MLFILTKQALDVNSATKQREHRLFMQQYFIFSCHNLTTK